MLIRESATLPGVSTPVPELEGLRERKKRRTRLEISDVATRLFAQRGFEAVTLAEIATAADVSIKTIFNYFGSKEDLYFDRADELTAALVETIEQRPPGTTVLEALRLLLTKNLMPFPGSGWGQLSQELAYGRLQEFLATQDRSPALRARRLTLADEFGDHLAGVLAAQLGRERDDPALRSLVAMLVATLHLRDRVMRTAMAAGVTAPTVRRRVTATVDDTFTRLATAFADVDREARAPR